MKVVLNRTLDGCFCLSPAALAEISERKVGRHGPADATGRLRRESTNASVEGGRPAWILELPRNDQGLVAIVERLGRAAGGPGAELTVIEIPDGSRWKVFDIMGYEVVTVGDRVF